MKILYFLLLSFALTSCSTFINAVNSTPLNKVYPEIDAVTNKEVGISLVTKEVGYLYKGLIVNEDQTIKPGTVVRELKRGEVFINKFDTKKYFLYESPTGGFGIAIDKNTGLQSFYSITGASVVFAKLRNAIDFTETTVPIKGKEYFKQEFIYNGKVGNGIKFVYREFADDFARPAFTQELQYDLSESKIIGFRGLRLEVIKATNTDIDYKVINHFSNR